MNSVAMRSLVPSTRQDVPEPEIPTQPQPVPGTPPTKPVVPGQPKPVPLPIRVPDPPKPRDPDEPKRTEPAR